jgi:hypothetical protein
MSDTRPSPKAFVLPPAWLLLVGVVLSLGIFSGTYFAYLSRYETHAHGSNFPLAIGVSSFFLLMSVVAYFAVLSPTLLGRIAKAVGLALTATGVFLMLFLFLVLNTLGS